MNDLEMQQYLFDLQGFLVIENALSADEVATLNRLIDEQNLPPPEDSTRFGSAPTLSASLVKPEPGVPEGEGENATKPPRLDPASSIGGNLSAILLDHPAIMPVLRMRLGDAFRLDRLYGMNMSKGHVLRRACTPIMARPRPQSDLGPGEYFAFRSQPDLRGFRRCRLGAVATAAASMAASAASPAATRAITSCRSGSETSTICRRLSSSPRCRAGSVILFTESLTHGTATWHAKHQRRALLYKYCVSHLAWTSKRVEAPTAIELTPRQQILLREPGDPLRHFPSLFEEVPA